MNRQDYEKTINCKYVRSFGKYELYKRSDTEYMVTDGWLCDWFLLYDFGGWAHDGLFVLRKDIRTYFDKLNPSMFKAA